MAVSEGNLRIIVSAIIGVPALAAIWVLVREYFTRRRRRRKRETEETSRQAEASRHPKQ